MTEVKCLSDKKMTKLSQQKKTGELCIQRNVSGVVATTSLPFYNKLHVLCMKSAPGTTFTSWSPFCCDWKTRAACGQSFALWQQATIENMHHNHSIIA